VISTNQFKNGNHIEVEGTVFKILEFQHVKPGKGGAFVRTKLRRTSDGNVIDRTFRAGEKFRPVHTEARKMQFLYADGTDAHFMDEESYEQLALPEPSVAEALKWVKPNETVDRPAGRLGRARGHAHRAGRARRHGLGRRQQAGDAGDRGDGERAAVREHRRPGQGGHALGLLHVACVGRSSGARPSSPCISTT
jgi:translation elongation factor P/translation initiation factor 5A